MLRITSIAVSPSRTKLRVQGRIVSDWIDVLEQECSGLLKAGKSVELDLADVTFVSVRGLEVLGKLATGKVEVTGCSPLIEEALKAKKAAP